MTTLRAIDFVPAAPARPQRHDLAWTLAGLAALLAWDLSGLDLLISGLFGGPEGFPLRDAWWARDLMHDGGRIASGLLLAGWLIVAWRAPRGAVGTGRPSRREHGIWLLATVAGLLLVPAIKRISTTSCPWDLSLFGGVAQYVSHWRFGQADGGGGHCFPSGHAVAAFAYFSLYFLWREHHARLARGYLAAVLLAGAAFGFAQLVRGAHFPSHTLWSAWACWTVCVVTAQLPRLRQSKPTGSA